jgi:predicted transcriptional regulator
MSEESEKRDFLLSIHPTYVEKIVGGMKTVELRRRFAEDVAPGAILLIYSTSPTQALVGSATRQKASLSAVGLTFGPAPSAASTNCANTKIGRDW